MTHFYFDIETIPAQDPSVRAEIAAGITAPGNYSKPESIAAWLATNKEAATEEAWLKTSFDGGVGQCVVIGFAVNDGPTHAYSVRDLSADSERQVLRDFFCALTDAGHCVLTGHNHIAFDIPFLWKRAMVLGVKPPFTFPRAPKAWSETVCDTMLLWDATQRAGGSLDRICRLLGIPGKGDFSGADVWPEIRDHGAAGITKVTKYCIEDVERTRAIHKRMTFAD